MQYGKSKINLKSMYIICHSIVLCYTCVCIFSAHSSEHITVCDILFFIYIIQECMSMLGASVLTFLSLSVDPPARYPDLWPVLVSIYSCGHFTTFLLISHYWQLTATSELDMTSDTALSKSSNIKQRKKFQGKKKLS